MKSMVFALVAAMLSGALFAEGEHYLYWMVDLEDSETEYKFSYATVKADDTLLTNYKNNEDAGSYVGADTLPDAGMSTEAYYAYDISEYVTGSTFLFELFNESNERVAWKSVTSGALSPHFGKTMSTVNPYTVSNVVPEPTSALLALLGFTGLALKRKRA